MKILIISNVLNNTINSSLYNLLGATKELISTTDSTCDILLLGYNILDVIKEIKHLKIINNLLIIDNLKIRDLVVENIAKQLSDIVKEYSHVLINSDSFGKNLLPRIAGILDIGQISDVVKIISPNIFRRYTYAGNILTEVESLHDINLLTIRSNNFNSYKEYSDKEINIKQIGYNNDECHNVKFIDMKVHNDTISLNNAKVIVSGGVSLESKLNFDTLIRGLAKKLNAAVGATRTAVEAGYISNDCQIGQTGTIVSPYLYIAIGISGAVQHIAGIKDSKIVIAINKDSNAPIFEHANYGLIGDLFEIIPYLINEIK